MVKETERTFMEISHRQEQGRDSSASLITDDRLIFIFGEGGTSSAHLHSMYVYLSAHSLLQEIKG